MEVMSASATDNRAPSSHDERQYSRSAASSELDEITVTATQRSERLQDVSVAVTAFTQETLDAQGPRDIDASCSWGSFGGGDGRFLDQVLDI